MCGITAILGYSEDAPPVDRSELETIRDRMLHRGPDGAGLWLDERRRVGLGHRRLSIIDLTDGGYQPMSTPDGLIRIVFNGEIYNYENIRNELIERGHQFVSTSDTEVILHLYLEKGAELVHELRGMYAFVIWDAQKQGMLLARDPFGVKPLYYHDDGRTFRCASQVKALVAGGGISLETEPAGRVGFFLWGSVPEPFTLYKNVMALPSGHTMWIDREGIRAPRQFFSVSEELLNAGSNPIRNSSAREILSDALRDSVRHHLIADVPVGVFLSSGLDSTVITALASESAANLQAITLGFGEYANTEMDEVPLAREVAAQYGCRHFVERVSQNDFDQELDAILFSMDQPTVDGVNTYFVSRAAAKYGLKVVLSGLGGDELLGSYPSFRQIPGMVAYTRYFSRLPGFGKTFRAVTAPVLKRLTSPKYAGLFEYGSSYGGAYLLRRGLFMPWELPEFMDGDVVRDGWERLQPVMILDNLVSGLSTEYAKISALEISQYMRNMLLRDSDWAGMAHSLEIRVPLVDIAVFRALAPLIASGTAPTKSDMAFAPDSSLPRAVADRPKTGFSIPVQGWLEAADISDCTRGLRGWAFKLMKEFFESSM